MGRRVLTPLELVEQSAPSTPSSGFAALYVKSDGKAYLKNDGGTEYDLTSGGGGGAVTATEVELDFGTTPVTSAIFAITDGSALTTNKVIAVQSYAAATGKAAEDNEWDALVLVAYVATNGTISLVAHAITGPVIGKFKINYLLA